MQTKQINNKRIIVLLYTILLSLNFTTKYIDHTTKYSTPFIFSFIIIILSLFNYKKNNNGYNKEIIKLFLWPAVIIHLYTIVLIIFGKVDNYYFSTNLSKYIPIIVSMCILNVFGKDAFKICFVSLIVSWSVTILLAFIAKGIGIFPYAIMSGYFNINNTVMGVNHNYFEIHDIVLSLGLPIIYSYYSKDKLLKRDLFVIFMYLFIMGLGIKRIAILGVLIVILLIIIYKTIKSTELKRKFTKALSILIFLSSFFYLQIIFHPGLIESLSQKYNINLMGRNYYYNAIINYGSLSPKFIGIGRNSITKILTREYSYMKVAGVHNDILKMYIENGFIMFTIWLFITLFYIPKYLLKKYGQSQSFLYMCLMAYTFIVYATDNVENYFIFQLFTIIIVYDFIIRKETKME